MKHRIVIDKSAPSGLQVQIVSEIARLIFDGFFPKGTKLPSCRSLALDLQVSINTVLGAYQTLQDSQWIESRQRSGFFVLAEQGNIVDAAMHPRRHQMNDASLRKINPTRRAENYQTIFRPENWHEYKYPFVCNQINDQEFPVSEWRECSRIAMNRKDLKIWSSDGQYSDSEELMEQVCHRILPRRSIFTKEDTTLITLGSQNGLFIAATLTGGRDRVAAIEYPGYPDAHKILRANFGEVRYLPVDAHGLVVDERLKGVDVIFVTPNRQFPMTVTMPEARRRELMDAAENYDFLIIEDDYECDVDYRNPAPLPLKHNDEGGRIIYLGSLSKGLSPGLRLGYMVAPAGFISAARDCRGMMLRHPPLILQHTAATFIRFGYYDSLLKRLRQEYGLRWKLANDAIEASLGMFNVQSAFGGTTFVLTDPTRERPARQLADNAKWHGVIFETIEPCFFGTGEGQYSFRIGVSSLSSELIEPGIWKLSEAVAEEF